MKRLVLTSALALSTLCFSTPLYAAIPPPLPNPSSSFRAGSIRVDVYGTPGKQSLIFIPGLTCGPWEWSGEIAQAAPSYTIYALTLPGFDGNPGVQAHPFETVSVDFWKMLVQHTITKPILIGHSLGGTLGIMLAEQHSDRLRGVIAVDGLPVFPGSERQSLQERTAGAQRFGAMLSSISTPQQFELAEKTYSLPYMMTSKDDVASVARLSAKSDPKASGAWAAEDFTLDLRPQLNNVHVPILEIGPYDPVLEKTLFHDAAEKQAYYTSLLSNDATARIEIVEDSRHFIMYDQPGRLHAALATFLQTL